MAPIIRKLTNPFSELAHLDFENEGEFINVLNEFPCSDKCSCGGFNEMTLENLEVRIGKYTIHLEIIPLLRCTKCKKKSIPEFTKELMYGAYKELLKRGNLRVDSRPSEFQKRYTYAESADFIYDHWDYESIPGLKFDEEHSDEGFLTPVYFHKNVLVNFINLPNYEVNLFSETYGNLAMLSQDDNYQYEWILPFGINSSGKVVFWLGDLNEIKDEASIHLLKAFNINSDHLLTESEFYQAQMCCLFSQPIVEKQILHNRTTFVKNIYAKYGIDLSHLDEEGQEYANTIARPFVFNQRTVSDVINAYDKILVEGISVDGLRRLYETLVGVQKRISGYEKWQSIKLIDKILSALSVTSKTKIDVCSVISPLYILHDYRILSDHLLPKEKQEEIKKHIIDTLLVRSFNEQETIYLEEVRRLNKLFLLLSLLSK